MERNKYKFFIAKNLARLNILHSRGNQMFSLPRDVLDTFVKIGMTGFTLDWFFNWRIPSEYIWMFTVGMVIVFIIIALIDKKFIGIWAEESQYKFGDPEINPYFEKWKTEQKAWQEKFEVKFNKLVEVFKDYVKTQK